MNNELYNYLTLKNKNFIVSIVIYTYLIIQLLLYIFSVFIHISIPENIIEYSSIIINLLFWFAFFIMFKEKHNFATCFMGCALLYTCIADAFLVIIGDALIPGIFFFCFVQLSYLLKQQLFQKKLLSNLKMMIFEIVIILFMEVIAYLIFKNEYNLLIALGVCYACMLFTNIILALFNYKENALLSIGFILFALCDINVGLKVICDQDSWFIDFIHNCPLDIITFFYLPSQILITMSLFYIKKSTFKEI